MSDMFDFLANVPYLPEVVAGLVAAHALAVFIVNLTPTPKDDAIVSKAYTWIEFIAGIVTKKAKDPAAK